MTHTHPPAHALPYPQRGAALIIGLIMLLILSLLGVTAISNVTLQEKMAGGLMDRNRAFQAAETALRIAEQEAATTNGGAGFYDVNAGTEQPDPSDVALWEENFFPGPTIEGRDSEIARAPRYRIERQIKFSNVTPTIYRISAVGYGNRPGSSVVLQTTFSVPDF